MWNFKPGGSAAENAANAQKVKQALEGLKGLVPEIVDIKVYINQLPYSTKDVMLDSLFADEAGFLAYMDNEDHKAVGVIVKEYLTDRVAFDYSD
jgi:hypothetical protein